MNLITPIILIAISIGTFFMYINPNYQGDNLGGDVRSIKSLQAEDEQYQTALNNTEEINMKRQDLVDKQGQISPTDLAKLELLMPDSVDNVSLVVNINQIAQNHGLVLKNIKLDPVIKSDTNQSQNTKTGTLGLSFSVSTSYNNFYAFLSDLENSLRLVDITDLSITGNDTGVYDFSLSLKTYWLK